MYYSCRFPDTVEQARERAAWVQTVKRSWLAGLGESWLVSRGPDWSSGVLASVKMAWLVLGSLASVKMVLAGLDCHTAHEI